MAVLRACCLKNYFIFIYFLASISHFSHAVITPLKSLINDSFKIIVLLLIINNSLLPRSFLLLYCILW